MDSTSDLVKRGYIYVLINPCIPNLVKIGKTRGVPAVRARKLSGSAVPTSFQVVCSLGVPDIHLTEARIFRALRKYRWNEKKEFFHLHPRDAVHIVKTLVLEFGLESQNM